MKDQASAKLELHKYHQTSEGGNSGYQNEFHYDQRFFYNPDIPDLDILIEYPSYRITILQSSKGGDSFVRRYDNINMGEGLHYFRFLQSCSDADQVILLYKTSNSYNLAHYNTESFLYSSQL